MPKVRLTSSNVAEPRGKWSHALRAGDLLFISGQTSRLPDGTITAQGDVREQARVALTRIRELCAAAGATMDAIVKLTILVKDIRDGDRVYEAYDEFFAGPDYPTDTLIGGVDLAEPEFLVEIEAIASLA